MDQIEKEETQAILEQKVILIKQFLDSTVKSFGEKNYQGALEQCIVIITLVREMIVAVNKERFWQRETISLEEAKRKVPPRHVMWYEVKNKYLPTPRREPASSKADHRELKDHIEYVVSCGCPQMSIEELDLSVRSNNCLRRGGIETVDDLISKTPSELMKIRNLGKTCMEEIVARLAEFDYSLREEE